MNFVELDLHSERFYNEVELSNPYFMVYKYFRNHLSKLASEVIANSSLDEIIAVKLINNVL